MSKTHNLHYDTIHPVTTGKLAKPFKADIILIYNLARFNWKWRLELITDGMNGNFTINSTKSYRTRQEALSKAKEAVRRLGFELREVKTL